MFLPNYGEVKWLFDVGQAVEHLFCKHEALSSNLHFHQTITTTKCSSSQLGGSNNAKNKTK
jgi:hypothetical protein